MQVSFEKLTSIS